MFILDTNTCIYFLKGKYPSIARHFLSTPPKEIKIPAIVKAELLFGAYKSQAREKTTAQVHQFLVPFEILPFADEMARDYAEIRGTLELSGQPIGANDLIIVATAQNKNGILVTHNTREFSRIPGLKITDWVEE